MAEQSAPITEFTLFSKVPIELKFKIWGMSMEGRVIEVIYDENLDFYYSLAANPTALRVCKESRQQALLSYKVLRLKDIYGGPRKNKVHFKTYINLKVDTVYLSQAHSEGFMGKRGPDDELPYMGANVHSLLMALSTIPRVASDLRSIAIDAESYEPDLIGMGLTRLKGLKEISIVFGDECCVNDAYSKHKKALGLVDVGPRNGPCAHLHRRAEDLEQDMQEGIEGELETMNKDRISRKQKPLVDKRDKTKYVVVPKMIAREWW
jgi:hypothetical protein